MDKLKACEYCGNSKTFKDITVIMNNQAYVCTSNYNPVLYVFISSSRDGYGSGIDLEIDYCPKCGRPLSNKAIAAWNNRTTIEFKEFEFPSWEEVETKIHKFSKVMLEGLLEFEVAISLYQPYHDSPKKMIALISKYEQDGLLHDIECHVFDYVEQGYTQARQWLNSRKLELCKQLAE